MALTIVLTELMPDTYVFIVVDALHCIDWFGNAFNLEFLVRMFVHHVLDHEVLVG